MIELTQPLSLNKSHGRRPAVPTGEDGKKEAPKTPQQIRLEALQVLRRGLSPQRWRVLDLLAIGGVLSVAQCQVSYRALRKYAQEQLLDRLPYTVNDLKQAMDDYGIPGSNDTDTLLYTLGSLGIEIARQRHGHPPPTGYLGYTLQRTLHDVVRNEIVLRLAHYAESLGWSVRWLGHAESTLIKDGEAILEPDALLILRHEQQEKAFLLEFHNEDKQIRAYEKVRRYEAAYATQLWQSQWGLAVFPHVLAVFTLPIIADGYQNAIREREQVHGHYDGKLLAGILDNNRLGEWTNIATGQREQLLGDSAVI
jgi:hypothetical protein